MIKDEMKLFCVLLSLFLMTTWSVKAQDLPLDKSVRTGKLNNGFRYYIKNNKYPENRAVLYLANKVGSVLEEEKERGLAHFIEHMNFKGTTHFPKNQLIDYLEKSGVKFGADLNAYTSFDETIYQLPIPTDNKSLWDNGLQIMRDWAAEALLDTEEFEKERGVILEEKRLQQNATGRMRSQYMPVLYNYSRYADRLPIGLDEVIGQADIKVLKDFYTKWYRPDLQALIVVGDIDIDQVEKQINALFSDLKPKGESITRPIYTIPLIDSTRFLQVKDKEFSNHRIELTFKRKTTPILNVIDFRTSVIQDLANSLMASRIQEVMREGSKSYLGLSIGAGSFLADLESLTIRIAMNPEKWNEGFKDAWTEVERIKKYGFSQEEYQDVKARLLTRISLRENEKNKISSYDLVEDYLQNFLTTATYLSSDDRITLTRQLLETINLTEIQNFIQQYLAEQDRVILVLSADKEGVVLPTQKEILNWITAVSTADIQPYIQDRKSFNLFDHKPKGALIIKEKIDKALNLTHWTLKNGVQIYAKPTTFKNDEILFSAFSKGGSSLYDDVDYYSTMNAPTFIVNSGLSKFSTTQLTQFLNAKAVQVVPYITDREEGLNGASIGRDLETGIAMLHLYMTDARLDTARFRMIMERSKISMKNRVIDPKAAFNDTVANILGNYHFRRQPTSVATLEQIRADRVETIFKERFANAADFTFLFVGNFDLDSLKRLTEQYLGSLPVNSSREQAKDLKIRVPEGKIRKDLEIGQGDKGTVQLVYSSKYKFSAVHNLYLDVIKETINFRMTERLRKQESGVYSPMIQVTKAKDPLGFYAFVISFDCDPKRKDALIVAVRDELQRLQKEGVVQEELDKFIAEESRKQELQSKSNQFWLSYLKGQLDKKESLDQFLNFPHLLKSLHLQEINKYCQSLSHLDNEIIVTLSPQKK